MLFCLVVAAILVLLLLDMRLETSSVGAPTLWPTSEKQSKSGCYLAYHPMGFGGGVIYETCPSRRVMYLVFNVL
jgi:hypothetical protein